jgi:hypothetical protein
MNYDPFEHRPLVGEIVAAWVICLGIVGLGLALSLHHRVPAAVASAPTTTHNSGAMAGVRLPGAYSEPTEPNPLPRNRFHPTEPMASYHSPSA